MAKFNFCITTGSDGFLPDDQQYVAADNAVAAFDAVKAAIRDFLVADGSEPGREADWYGFFDRGCRMPDASTWNFTLAYGDGVNLSLVGMTQDEFDQESV